MAVSSTGDVRIDAFAAQRAGGALQPYQYARGALGPNEVDIAVTHCGICHSDLHLIDNDGGVSTYPLVPGHEIIGTVTQAGSEAAEMRAGQRVGVGWLAGSCMSCEQCRGGNENLCFQVRPTWPVIALLDGQKSIGGSAIGSNAEIREMFRFSAKHAIMPMTELYPMKEVNQALDRLRQNRVRYRAVLANES